MYLTFVCVAPVSERAHSVDVEAVLLLADRRVSFLHLSDVGLLVSLPAVLAQPFLLEHSSLFFVQRVKRSLRAT